MHDSETRSVSLLTLNKEIHLDYMTAPFHLSSAVWRLHVGAAPLYKLRLIICWLMKTADTETLCCPARTASEAWSLKPLSAHIWNRIYQRTSYWCTTVKTIYKDNKNKKIVSLMFPSIRRKPAVEEDSPPTLWLRKRTRTVKLDSFSSEYFDSTFFFFFFESLWRSKLYVLKLVRPINTAEVEM